MPAVNIPILWKQPSEDRIYSFDYSEMPEIKDNLEYITAAGTVTASPSGLTIGTPSIDSGQKKVNVRISGGTTAISYTVTNSGVTTSGSNTLEGEFTLRCKNL